MFIREVRLFVCVSSVSCTNKTDGAHEILLKLALIRHSLKFVLPMILNVHINL